MDNTTIQEYIDKYTKKVEYFKSIQFPIMANDYQELVNLLEEIKKELPKEEVKEEEVKEETK